MPSGMPDGKAKRKVVNSMNETWRNTFVQLTENSWQTRITGIVAAVVLFLGGPAAVVSGQPAGAGGMPEGGMPGGMPEGMMQLPSTANTDYFAGICIEDGRVVEKRSTPGVVSGGTVENTAASGVTITSGIDDLNGIFVRGASEYTLSDADIVIDADGSNDFLGLGAGAMAEGGATLILKNVNITTTGVTACATVASNKSVLKVYNSKLIVNGGTLPEDYVPFIGPGMKEPPAPLGISGNARAHVTMDNSESYFYDSTIISEGWGALSTDSAQGYVYLEANNCDVTVRKSGYATYADNGCSVVINNSRLNTPTHTGIMGGESKVVLNDTRAVSGGIGFLIHNVNSGADVLPVLGINGGRMETKDAVVLIKSANADIHLEGGELVSHSGILIQSRLNDDGDAIKVSGEVPGINVVLKEMTLEGDIRHGDTERKMRLAFMDTRLTGSVQNAILSLTGDSKWTATSDSRVTLTDSAVANLDAVSGVVITAIAGDGCISEGTYQLESGGILKVQ